MKNLKLPLYAITLIFALTFALTFTFTLSPGLAKSDEPLAQFTSEGMNIQAVALTQGHGVIWGFDFLPGGKRIIFTERQGRIQIFNMDDKSLTEVKNAPEVAATGQGGLLDIYLHPDFERNNQLFLTYSESVKGGHTTTLARAELKDHRLEKLRPIFRARPASRSGLHFGSRIVIDNDGFLFLTVGDRGDRDQAQNLNSHLGKLLRLRQDGSTPRDNPFIGRENTRAEVWSYGHRNPQGLTIHPETKKIWLQEHGPRGGDEINLIEKAKNYGWPVITYGREYHGPTIGPTHKEGMEQPIHHYTPSIAPAGLTFYYGDKFPQWKGSLFSGALVLTHLNRLTLEADGSSYKVKKEERLLEGLKKRIRNVKDGPDGFLYLSTDDGYLIRLQPD